MTAPRTEAERRKIITGYARNLRDLQSTKPDPRLAVPPFPGHVFPPAVAAARQSFDHLQQEAFAAWKQTPEPRQLRPRFNRLFITGGSVSTLTAEPDGWVNRSTLVRALNRPETASIDTALDDLLRSNSIECHTAKGPDAGRPTTSYRIPR